jgi:hypothetical protein
MRLLVMHPIPQPDKDIYTGRSIRPINSKSSNIQERNTSPERSNFLLEKRLLPKKKGFCRRKELRIFYWQMITILYLQLRNITRLFDEKERILHNKEAESSRKMGMSELF